jgi:argininosuccinate synthase
MKVKKVVLAYSGGLDTSVCLRWIMEQYRCEVVAYCADLGQGEDLEAIKRKALATGASKVVVDDLREEFVKDYIFPMLRANAVYEGSYLLGTSIARPLIAKRQIDVAKDERADSVAHGSTGKGNDQVRFELAYYALKPDVKVIAPWRLWNLRSRKALEDPWREPPASMFLWTTSPEKAPDRPEYIEVDFSCGDPVALNGRTLSPAALLTRLNGLGAKHGVGRVDLVEDRYVGMRHPPPCRAPSPGVHHHGSGGDATSRLSDHQIRRDGLLWLLVRSGARGPAENYRCLPGKCDRSGSSKAVQGQRDCGGKEV